MYDNKMKEKFVELRAQGKSFVSIADTLGVSKPTLVDWSHELQDDIRNLRTINDEAMRERYQATKEYQLRLLSLQMEKVTKELENRDLKDVSTLGLFGIFAKLQKELGECTAIVKFEKESDLLNWNDLNTRVLWEA